MSTDPHGGMPVLFSGADADKASAAMIMIHGRGATAQDIISLAQEFKYNNQLLFAAPSASGFTWYPYSFLAPEKDNEPFLSSALNSLKRLVENIESMNIPSSKIFLLGFSQGACLALEYTARNAKEYAGIFGLSGALIGNRLDTNKYSGSFNKTPVFLGCSDTDPHIPLQRVNETEKVLLNMGAEVIKKIYPGMPHTINKDEINVINMLLIKALE